MTENRTGTALDVVLADDAVLLREGVRSVLEDEGISVLASVGDGDQLLTAVADHRPRLAIVDVRMPPTHSNEGLLAALRIKQEHPEVGVLMLSQHVAREYASDLLSTEPTRPGSATCSRTASPRSTASWTRCVGSQAAARSSTPRWCGRCCARPISGAPWRG